jgi:hypothetical protein
MSKLTIQEIRLIKFTSKNTPDLSAALRDKAIKYCSRETSFSRIVDYILLVTNANDSFAIEMANTFIKEQKDIIDGKKARLKVAQSDEPFYTSNTEPPNPSSVPSEGPQLASRSDDTISSFLAVGQFASSADAKAELALLEAYNTSSTPKAEEGITCVSSFRNEIGKFVGRIDEISTSRVDLTSFCSRDGLISRLSESDPRSKPEIKQHQKPADWAAEILSDHDSPSSEWDDEENHEGAHQRAAVGNDPNAALDALYGSNTSNRPDNRSVSPECSDDEYYYPEVSASRSANPHLVDAHNKAGKKYSAWFLERSEAQPEASAESSAYSVGSDPEWKTVIPEVEIEASKYPSKHSVNPIGVWDKSTIVQRIESSGGILLGDEYESSRSMSTEGSSDDCLVGMPGAVDYMS